MVDTISVAIVEKYLLKELAIVVGSVKVALLSMIALGDVCCELWFCIFFRSLMFYGKKIG